MVNLKGRSLLIHYCDKCAQKYGYPMKKEKEKESCVFCRFTGPVNQTPQESIVDVKNYNPEIWEGGGFKVSQQIPFPIQQSHDRLYPTLSCKMLNEKCLLFYDKNILVIVNPKTGQQIQVDFY